MTLEIDNAVRLFLDELGLSDTEQKLYLAGLEYPEASVTKLVRETGVNRTTAYHALGTLQQKALASESKVLGQLVYNMTDPSDLSIVLDRKQERIKRQKHHLTEIVDLFPGSATQSTQDTYVEKFVGLDAVKNAIEKALYCKSREWEIIAPKDNFFSQVSRDYAQYFMETRKSQKIHARSLWEEGFKPRRGLQVDDLLLRKPRYLPNEYTGKFESVVILFDDKALFISSAKQQSAVLIQSDAIVGTMRVMFEALWASSQKPL